MARSSSRVRTLWHAWRCLRTSGQPTMRSLLWGRYRGLISPLTAAAYKALEATLDATGYGTPNRANIERRCPTGVSGKRCKSSGRDCSLHNYSLAIDVDPRQNPHFHRSYRSGAWSFDDIKLTRAQVEAVEAIRTYDGVQVFVWLGWAIGDTMHFYIQASPSEIAVGIDPATIPGDHTPPMEGVSMYFVEHGDGMPTTEDPDPGVAYWQEILKALGRDSIKVDGRFWDETKGHVAAVVPTSDGMQINASEASAIHIQLGLLGPEVDDPPFDLDELDARYAPVGHPHTIA